ncbi:hypothetical protein LCGC14_3009630 [marine sediment metagenome]|uniref:Uncharacterized protein n=1 Tax=marine sediment metagenome TaxID=412755 RepID=A0A0F8ZPU0_9ZZZZ
MFNFFGRNTKYRKVVAEARKAAEISKRKTVVYQKGKNYSWCMEWAYFLNVVELSDQPIIKLLICLPGGEVSQ